MKASGFSFVLSYDQLRALTTVTQMLRKLKPPGADDAGGMCCWFTVLDLSHKLKRKLDFHRNKPRVSFKPHEAAALLELYLRFNWSQLLEAYIYNVFTTIAGHLHKALTDLHFRREDFDPSQNYWMPASETVNYSYEQALERMPGIVIDKAD